MFGSDDFLPPLRPGRRARVKSWLRGFAGADRVPEAGATILVYHSVADVWGGTWTDPRFWVPEPVFRAQLEYLKQHRTVVSLADLVESLAAGRSPAPGTVVLTFDDAYLDHATVAVPLLKSLELPATFFVPTGWVGGRAPWADDLYGALAHRRNARLDLGTSGRFDLRWPGHLRRAYRVLESQLMHMADPDERLALIDRVRAQLETYGRPPRRTMTWDELRELAGQPGVEIGAHGVQHLSLPKLSPQAQRAEIEDGVDRLEHELHRRPRFFAYPYGHHDAATDAIVAKFGFSAVAVEKDSYRVDAAADPMHLGRCGAKPTVDQLEHDTQ